MTKIFSILFAAAIALIGAGAAPISQAWAQSFPSRQVSWVVPYPPGGPTDIIARIVATKLGERLGHPVIVENRAGGDGNVGSQYVAQAAPDGHTILFVVPGIVTNPLFLKVAIDPFKELTGVTQLDVASMVLLASNKFGEKTKTVPEIVAMARTQPGSISCGSSGAFPTMGCELLQANSGKLTMVRYRGNGPALAALGTSEIDILFDVVNTAREAVSAGRVKAVASTNPRRGLGPFKDLPVIAETIPSLVLVTWHGVMAPKNTPPDIVAALNKGLREALQAPEIRSRMEQLGFEVTGISAADFNTLLKDEAEKYRKIVTAAGIQPE